MGRKRISIEGAVYGKLTVLCDAGKGHHGEIQWLCRCSCGNNVVYTGHALRNRRATTCGRCLHYEVTNGVVKATDVNDNSFIFDIADYPVVINYRWWVNKSGYVSTDSENGTRILLHCFLMSPQDGMVVDHINGDKTDCRRCNLRVVTKKQNSYNSGLSKRNKSGFKGVYYDPVRGKYEAYIRPEGRKLHLGRFETAEEAADAYDKAAIRLFGEYARTNKTIKRRSTNGEILELGA